MGLLIKASCFLFLAFLVYRIIHLGMLFGYGREVFYHAPGPCRIVQGIENGSEDIQALSNGLAFITNGLHFPHIRTDDHYKHVKGNIYLFDFNHPDKNPEKLKLVGDDFNLDTFIPHGLSLWQDAKGNVYLYVVNHVFKENTEAVEKFLFDPKSKSLIHKKRFTSKENANFRMLNDLVVVGEDQFYYTNYLYMSDTLEIYGQLAWGSVGYFDGQRASIVADGLMLPNGINVSPDLKYMYLSNIGKQELRIYNIHKDRTLSLKQAAYIGTILDNLDVDASGDVWAGAHPIAHKTLAHQAQPYKVIAPSQVLHFSMKDGYVQNVTEVYSEQGHHLSASTVAVYYKNAMLVGSICHNMLYCTLKT